jgi:hypothetical protein
MKNPVYKFPVDVPDSIWLCRMCEHLAHAKDNGQECCGKDLCGGPRQGRSFPLYRGPLASVVYKYCYMCGDDSVIVIERGNGGKLGLCRVCADRLFTKPKETE